MNRRRILAAMGGAPIPKYNWVDGLTYSSSGEQIQSAESSALIDFVPYNPTHEICIHARGIGTNNGKIIQYNANKTFQDYWSPNLYGYVRTFNNGGFLRFGCDATRKRDAFVLDLTSGDLLLTPSVMPRGVEIYKEGVYLNSRGEEIANENYAISGLIRLPRTSEYEYVYCCNADINVCAIAYNEDMSFFDYFPNRLATAFSYTIPGGKLMRISYLRGMERFCGVFDVANGVYLN